MMVHYFDILAGDFPVGYARYWIKLASKEWGKKLSV